MIVRNNFTVAIVFFWKVSIFDSKFLENYITDFQSKTSFELNRARAFEWYIFLVPTMKFNFPALWLVEIFGHFLAQIFLNIDMKLLFILIFADKIPLTSNPLTWSTIPQSLRLRLYILHIIKANCIIMI